MPRPIFRNEFPRLYELWDLCEDPNAPNTYFHGFDSLLSDPWNRTKPCYEKLESYLQGLGLAPWIFLKKETRSYLAKKDQKGRGWQQLFAILNQAKGYNYLRRVGCLNVQFIPRATIDGVETPDLEGEIDHRKVLCEVKTINISDIEVAARNGSSGLMREIVEKPLEPGFFHKLSEDFKKAKQQMEAYDGRPDVRRIVYVVVNFDNFWGDFKERHYQQIDQYLSGNTPAGIEIVFLNEQTHFHTPISMTYATVIN